MKEFIIISAVICIAISHVCSNAFMAKAKREGYKRAKKSSFPEKLKEYITLCIPIINIMLALIMLFMQYETILIAYLKDVTLVKEDTP